MYGMSIHYRVIATTSNRPPQAPTEQISEIDQDRHWSNVLVVVSLNRNYKLQTTQLGP